MSRRNHRLEKKGSLKDVVLFLQSLAEVKTAQRLNFSRFGFFNIRFSQFSFAVLTARKSWQLCKKQSRQNWNKLMPNVFHGKMLWMSQRTQSFLPSSASRNSAFKYHHLQKCLIFPMAGFRDSFNALCYSRILCYILASTKDESPT